MGGMISSYGENEGKVTTRFTSCKSCGKSSYEELKKCGRCMNVYYCNSECQKTDWLEHKKFCNEQKEKRSKLLFMRQFSDRTLEYFEFDYGMCVLLLIKDTQKFSEMVESRLIIPNIDVFIIFYFDSYESFAENFEVIKVKMNVPPEMQFDGTMDTILAMLGKRRLIVYADDIEFLHMTHIPARTIPLSKE